MTNRSWHPMAPKYVELANRSWYLALRDLEMSDDQILHRLIAVGVEHLGPDTGFEMEPGDRNVEVFVEQVRQIAWRSTPNEWRGCIAL